MIELGIIATHVVEVIGYGLGAWALVIAARAASR